MRFLKHAGRAVFLAAMVLFVRGSAWADDVDDAIGVISRTGPNALGSLDARQARDRLVQHDARILPRLLVAIDTPNIVAANWYRTAFDAIADRELARPEPHLPAAAIEEFVRDAHHGGRPRRLGLRLLERLKPDLRDRLLGDWLDDPEFRREAVAKVLLEGDLAQRQEQTDSARQAYERAFRHARDGDQVLDLAARLKSVGRDVDPISHLGFVTRWWIIGPFAAPGTTGFAAEFPPRHEQNLGAEYDDDDDQKVRWRSHQTADRLGEVNLIDLLGTAREAVAYAYAEIEAPRAQHVRLACSADDNLTVWINDQQVLAREQWLNATRMDRFVVPVDLRAGRNRVLVKICQGPKHVSPEVPNNWSFQLRFCDATGGSAEFRQVVLDAP